MKKIRQIPQAERPREKLRTRGAESLSDVELLAVLLGCGTRGHDVLAVSSRILDLSDRTEDLNFDRLLQVDGVGPAKATLLAAALEFARRKIQPAGFKIRLAEDILPLVLHYADRKQEYFFCITLNGAHEVIATRVISVGLVNSTQVHPREVFADAITDRAVAVVVAHNHPSGNLTPSRQDIQATKSLQRAASTLGIQLLDHVIFDSTGYYSFKESNLL